MTALAWSFLFTLSLSAGPAWTADAPPPELITELKGASAQGVRVGDRLELSVRLPEGRALEALTVETAPDGRAFREQGWEVRSLPPSAEEPTPGEIRIRVYPLQPGELELPPIWLRDAEKKIVGRTQPLRVRVSTAIPPAKPDPSASPGQPPEEPKPADSLPPVHLMRPLFVKGLYALVIFLGLATLVGVVVALIRRSRRKADGPEIDPLAVAIEPKTAERDALEALRRLDAKGWPAQGDHRKHFYAASRVLKRYLGAVHAFDAEESTTQEIVERLRGAKGVASARVIALTELLQSMDRVKYARGMPSGPESQALTRQVRDWIEGGKRAV